MRPTPGCPWTRPMSDKDSGFRNTFIIIYKKMFNTYLDVNMKMFWLKN